MTLVKTTPSVVAVVDGNPHRYAFLADLQDQGRVQLILLENGRSALRLSAPLEPSFWLVNDQLADMRGIDCIEMLVALYPDARYFLIADEYDANEERLCFRFMRVKYLCRPLDALWLGRLLRSVMRPVMRPQRASDGDESIPPAVEPRQHSANHHTKRDATRAPPAS